MNASNALDFNFEGVLPGTPFGIQSHRSDTREKTVSTEENLVLGYSRVVVFDLVHLMMAASAMALQPRPRN